MDLDELEAGNHASSSTGPVLGGYRNEKKGKNKKPKSQGSRSSGYHMFVTHMKKETDKAGEVVPHVEAFARFEQDWKVRDSNSLQK